MRRSYVPTQYTYLIIYINLQGKIPNAQIQKFFKLYEYIEDFKLTSENSAIFRFCVIIREP